MLTTAHAVLPAADLGRMRGFYHDKLGLDPSEEHRSTLVYGEGAGAFEVYETPNAGTARNTQLTWMVDDLDAEMARLREAGVEFMDFQTPEFSTDHGVATDGEMRSAWFTDSEGNILCLTERA